MGLQLSDQWTVLPAGAGTSESADKGARSAPSEHLVRAWQDLNLTILFQWVTPLASALWVSQTEPSALKAPLPSGLQFGRADKKIGKSRQLGVDFKKKKAVHCGRGGQKGGVPKKSDAAVVFDGVAFAPLAWRRVPPAPECTRLPGDRFCRRLR
jgi:hypothetical protein